LLFDTDEQCRENFFEVFSKIFEIFEQVCKVIVDIEIENLVRDGDLDSYRTMFSALWLFNSRVHIMTKQTFSFEQDSQRPPETVINLAMLHNIGINATLVFMVISWIHRYRESAVFPINPACLAAVLPLSIYDVCLAVQTMQESGLLLYHKTNDDGCHWYRFNSEMVYSLSRYDEIAFESRLEQIMKELQDRYGAKTHLQGLDFCNKIVETHQSTQDFRTKYPANIRARDGHYVRSRAEALIDNWFHCERIAHEYEREVVTEKMWCDFYLPDGGIYVEFWGLESNPKYAARKKAKIALYRKYDLPLLEIVDADINRLDEVLPRKLLKYGIIVH